MSVGDTKAIEHARPQPPAASAAPKPKAKAAAQPRSQWVAGQSYVHIGGVGKSSRPDPMLQAISARQREIQKEGQVLRTTARFVELEVDRTTTVIGAVIDAFTSTRDAFLNNCPSLGKVKAGGDLLLDGCPKTQSVQAGGWLALIRSEASKLFPGYSSLTYLPSSKKLVRIERPSTGMGLSILPPAPPKPAPDVAPATLPPLKKERKWCTRNCAIALLTTAVATALAVGGYFYYTQATTQSGGAQ